MNDHLLAKTITISLVISEFNKPIIENLLNGARDAFFNCGGNKNNLNVYRVPGAFEIPGTIKQILKYHKPNAIVALGAIIRGDTPHFDYVASESAHGLSQLSLSSDIPIINGILTTDNVMQAKQRSEVKGNNKGWDSIFSAIKTIAIYREISSVSSAG